MEGSWRAGTGDLLRTVVSGTSREKWTARVAITGRCEKSGNVAGPGSISWARSTESGLGSMNDIYGVNKVQATRSETSIVSDQTRTHGSSCKCHGFHMPRRTLRTTVIPHDGWLRTTISKVLPRTTERCREFSVSNSWLAGDMYTPKDPLWALTSSAMTRATHLTPASKSAGALTVTVNSTVLPPETSFCTRSSECCQADSPKVSRQAHCTSTVLKLLCSIPWHPNEH